MATVKTAKITFHRVYIDYQEYRTDEELIIARVSFDLSVPDTLLTFRDLYAPIKQIVGSSFDTSPLEIGNPCAYYGPFNVQAFQDETEKYYRSLVGAEGGLIKFGKDAKNTHLNNVVLNSEKTITLEVDLDESLGWNTK